MQASLAYKKRVRWADEVEEEEEIGFSIGGASRQQVHLLHLKCCKGQCQAGDRLVEVIAGLHVRESPGILCMFRIQDPRMIAIALRAAGNGVCAGGLGAAKGSSSCQQNFCRSGKQCRYMSGTAVVISEQLWL